MVRTLLRYYSRGNRPARHACSNLLLLLLPLRTHHQGKKKKGRGGKKKTKKAAVRAAVVPANEAQLLSGLELALGSLASAMGLGGSASPPMEMYATQSEWVRSARVGERYTTACSAADRLRAAQRTAHPTAPFLDALGEVENREGAALAAFRTWFDAQAGAAAISPSVAFRASGEMNGVFVVEECVEGVKRGTELLRVPRHLVMDAVTWSGAAVCASDPLLRSAKTVALALRLLCECGSPATTAFGPFLAVLPQSLSIPLHPYWSPGDVLALTPSTSLIHVVRHTVTTLKHYCYLAQLLRSPRGAPLRALGLAIDAFTFDAFAWAIGIVMTRQNRVPVGAGGGPGDMALALVPAFDMFNHGRGELSADWIDDSESVEGGAPLVVALAGSSDKPSNDYLILQAMRDFEVNEEVRIFYGPRTTSDFLIFSGFLPAVNPYDRIDLPLPLPDREGPDALAKIRVMLLGNNGVVPKASLPGAPTSSGKAPVVAMLAVPYYDGPGGLGDATDAPFELHASLLSYARVAVAVKSELASLLKHTGAGPLPAASPEHDVRAMRWLSEQLQALQRMRAVVGLTRPSSSPAVLSLHSIESGALARLQLAADELADA